MQSESVEPVIISEHLSKRYLLIQQEARYSALRDVIASKAKAMFKKNDANARTEFLALNDVNFQIKQGERVGIIGRNGAGKSTLLKILARIVSPTSGRVTISGRVASLLEVGTGFHPELSGRENIFLNGAILGMSKHEIKSKFDAIVDFAEVQQFLDTPVKRYSSGMYVRLAFAVAAHLEPEILIVDEVLAVGDAQFQNKCLGKMRDVSGSGRTILFVSHNMGAIKSLCDKTIVLQKGQVVFDGDVNSGVNYYLSNNSIQQTDDLEQRTDRTGNGKLRFTSIGFRNSVNESVYELLSGEELYINIGFKSETPLDLSKLILSVAFTDDYLNPVLAFVSDEMGCDFSFLKGKNEIRLHIPQLLLRGNRYGIKLFVAYGDTMSSNILDSIETAVYFTVLSSDFYKSGKTIRDGNYGVQPAVYC